MAEKRVRATLTQVRGLERALASQLDGTSLLVAECDAWREKCRGLVRELDDLRGSALDVLCEAKELRGRVEALESESNGLADEVVSLRGRVRGGVLSRLLWRVGL